MSPSKSLNPGDICPDHDWCSSNTRGLPIMEDSLELMSYCLSDNRGEGEKVIGGENNHLVIFFVQMGEDSQELDLAELREVDDNLQKFKDLDCGVVAITDANILTMKKWMIGTELDGRLGFPIISNNNKEIAKTFRVLDEDSGLIVMVVFIVSSYKQECLQCSKIRYVEKYHNTVKTKRSIEDLLRIIKGISEDDPSGAVIIEDQEPETSINEGQEPKPTESFLNEPTQGKKNKDNSDKKGKKKDKSVKKEKQKNDKNESEETNNKNENDKSKSGCCGCTIV